MLINSSMGNKARYFPNMTTFTTVRRGEWRFKVSVYSNKFVLIVAQHIYNGDAFIRYFDQFITASNFIDNLVEQDKT
jgi:hypothetical protein